VTPPTTPPHRRRLGVLVGIALLVSLVDASAAWGSPIDDKKAEAARVQSQLEEKGRRASVLDERYNQAALALQRLQAALAKAQGDFRASDQRLAVARSRMTRAAISAYMGGGSASMLARLTGSEGDDFIVRSQYLRMAAAEERAAIDALRTAREELTTMRQQLEDRQRSARAATDKAAEARRAAEGAVAEQEALLGKVKGELAALVAAEAERRQAEAARTARELQAALSAQVRPAAKSPLPKALVAPPSGPNAPAPNPRAAIAVAEAKKQIGKPYRWGGEGPDSFDCSGLTMYAWKAAGVSLSHSAAAQYNETTRIPVSAIQPGDLLFFGRPIHHNGMYVGDGTMVEASQTGVPVRYAPAFRRDLVGVGRVG
jgi:cell wall-associated NlpC family hydrolase